MKHILIAVLVLFANSAWPAPPPNPVPKRFEARFGGLGGWYDMKLQEGVLLCTKSLRGKDTTLKISPTKKEWTEFRQALDKVGAAHWRTNYLNQDVMDGTHWSLTVDYSDLSIRGSGLNSYPDEKGKPGPDSHYTKAFDAYTKALDKLTGSKFMKDD